MPQTNQRREGSFLQPLSSQILICMLHNQTLAAKAKSHTSFWHVSWNKGVAQFILETADTHPGGEEKTRIGIVQGRAF